GAELAGFFAEEDDLATDFAARFDGARRARSVTEVLEDRSIELVASAGINADRGPLGLDVMRHDKDFLTDKPAFTSLDVLEEARRVQRETGRKFIVDYSERTRNPAVVKAGELVADGAIGRVLQTIGL